MILSRIFAHQRCSCYILESCRHPIWCQLGPRSQKWDYIFLEKPTSDCLKLTHLSWRNLRAVASKRKSVILCTESVNAIWVTFATTSDVFSCSRWRTPTPPYEWATNTIFFAGHLEMYSSHNWIKWRLKVARFSVVYSMPWPLFNASTARTSGLAIRTFASERPENSGLLYLITKTGGALDVG